MSTKYLKWLSPSGSTLHSTVCSLILQNCVLESFFLMSCFYCCFLMCAIGCHVSSRFLLNATISDLLSILVFILTGVFIQTEFSTQPPLLGLSHSLISLHTLKGQTDKKNIQYLQLASMSRWNKRLKKLRCSRVNTLLHFEKRWC